MKVQEHLDKIISIKLNKKTNLFINNKMKNIIIFIEMTNSHQIRKDNNSIESIYRTRMIVYIKLNFHFLHI